MRRWTRGTARPVAATVIAVGLASLACSGLGDQEHALDPSDHAVLLEMRDLQSEFPQIAIDPQKETWSKVKSMGTWELDYAYEADDFVLTSMVFVENTADDASWVLWGLGLAPAMMENEGIEFREDASLLTLGDERQCGVLLTDSQPTGNLCSVRDGSVAMAIVMIGGYFDQPGSLDPIFGPVLASASGYTPKASPLP